MTNTEATRLAILHLGPDATTDDVVRHAAEQLGVRLESRFVPIYRATLRGEEQRKGMWVIAARVAEEDRQNPPAKRRKSA